MSSGYSLCQACSSIGLERKHFEDPPFEPEGRYNSIALTGNLSRIRASEVSCSLCRLISQALEKNEECLDEEDGETEWELIWKQNNFEYDPNGENAEDLYGSGLYPQLKRGTSTLDHCIQLVDEPSTMGFLRGRLIPESINPEMILGWMRRCTEKHGESCIFTHFKTVPHPALKKLFEVIDVLQECIVDMPSLDRYAALSYVWGQTNNVRTIKSLVSAFRKPRAFKSIQLPKTIRDAMDLTRALGIPYLWVDCICIVQDDKETQGTRIEDMDSIYGGATITILAASGSDAQAGLPGWRSSLPERKLIVETIGQDFTLGVLQFFDGAIMRSVHAERGWTHQEGCLSRRCLVILGGKAFFSCRGALWREDVMAELDNVTPFEGANTLGRTMSSWPLRRYAQHVDEYSMRKLTFQSDGHNAFMGLESALASSMGNTKMFFGMPAVAFDWAMLWSGRTNNLRRRDGFPSWSWVGWQGDILMTIDMSSSIDHKWLLERTWIDWFLVDKNLKISATWDPDRDHTIVSELVLEDKKLADKDDEDDEESEEEACPTYGQPTTDDSYGRQTKPQVLPSLPKPEHTILDCDTENLEPGTLVFHTVIAHFTIDARITPFPHRSACCRIRDGSGRICGMIWESTDSPAPAIRPLILLSQASPATTSMLGDGRDAHIGFADEYKYSTVQEGACDGENMLGEWHNWDFFNVMLPKRGGREIEGEISVYERDGIGLLHRSALAHCVGQGPGWKTLCLE